MKIPVLRYTTNLKSFVYFWIGMATIYYVSMFGWFVYGVSVIYRLAVKCPRGWVNDKIVDPEYYDAVTLKALMAIILGIYWIMMILLI